MAADHRALINPGLLQGRHKPHEEGFRSAVAGTGHHLQNPDRWCQDGPGVVSSSSSVALR